MRPAPAPSAIPYAELDVRTNFSFLEGGSHPAELVAQAHYLGLSAMGVADRNTLAGVVRAHAEAKKRGLRLLIGCRLQFTDGAELIVYPRDRAAYGRLCGLLSMGKSGITQDPSSHGLAKRDPGDPSDLDETDALLGSPGPALARPGDDARSGIL